MVVGGGSGGGGATVGALPSLGGGDCVMRMLLD